MKIIFWESNRESDKVILKKNLLSLLSIMLAIALASGLCHAAAMTKPRRKLTVKDMINAAYHLFVFEPEHEEVIIVKKVVTEDGRTTYVKLSEDKVLGGQQPYRK